MMKLMCLTGLLLSASHISGSHKLGKKQLILEKVNENGDKLDYLIGLIESGEYCGGGGETTTTTSTTTDKAILVVGGCTQGSCSDDYARSVEVLNANGTSLCLLDSLPPGQGRYGQSQVGTTMCGGTFNTGTNDRCIEYGSGTWGSDSPLLQSRYTSPSLSKEDGLLLMGGYYTDSTEIYKDGSSSDGGFSLDMGSSFSCGIDLGDATVIVGGEYTWSDVRVVYADGSQMSLPSLNEGRRVPACGHYVDDSGNENLVVAAGGNSNYDYTDTTEWYDYGGSGSQWYFVGNYPYQTWWPTGISIDNNVFSTGGYADGNYIADIYKFNKDSKSWELVDYMFQSRCVHGMSVVNRADVEPYCTNADKKQETRFSAPDATSNALGLPKNA